MKNCRVNLTVSVQFLSSNPVLSGNTIAALTDAALRKNKGGSC